jgi:hypothetical protein
MEIVDKADGLLYLAALKKDFRVKTEFVLIT